MSRHQATMLEPRRQPPSAAGRAAARRKRGLLRRTGIVLPAAAIAAVLVALVTIVSYLVSPNGSGAGNLSQAIDGLAHTPSIGLLEAERQQIIVMNAAASAMTSAAKPAVVSPSDIYSAGGNGGASGGNSATSQDTGPVVAPDPGTAQQIAFQMMSSYGFSQSSQWSCLDKTWTKESNWQYDAENASGAYGIPQSLPASRMAAQGSDYMTNPTTQIKWGLWYIQTRYGTPCGAWEHEVNDGWY